jgi:hypothetical protein
MRASLLVLLAAFVAAGPAHAVRVSVDHDKDADFSRYQTYTRAPGTPAKSELNQKRIDAALDAQLAAKGLKRVDSGGDLKVVTHAGSEKTQQVRVTDYGYGYYPGYWGSYYRYVPAPTIDVHDVIEGTLVVDLVDASSDQLVWRGTATDTVSPSVKPEKVEKIITKAMEKLFRQYPPK